MVYEMQVINWVRNKGKTFCLTVLALTWVTGEIYHDYTEPYLDKRMLLRSDVLLAVTIPISFFL